MATHNGTHPNDWTLSSLGVLYVLCYDAIYNEKAGYGTSKE